MAFPSTALFPSTASFPLAASFPSTASFPSAYDPDAVNYFASSGVTDPNQRLNISNFFTGLKSASLWYPLIDGYSFRSNQNVGSGASAKSFKNFFNATLVNSPAWGTDGITGNGTDQSITTSLIPNSGQSCSTFLILSLGTGSFRPIFSYGQSINDFLSGYEASPGRILTVQQSVGNYAQGNQVLSGFNSYIVNIVVGAVHSTRLVGTNGSSQTTGSLVSGSDGTPIFSGLEFLRVASTFFSNGTTSICLVFNKKLTTSENASLHSLIKSTIGQGLSLI